MLSRADALVGVIKCRVGVMDYSPCRGAGGHVYKWGSASHPLLLLPSAYLLLRRPEFINAILNYAAHLSLQLRGTWHQSIQGLAIGSCLPAGLLLKASAPRGWAGTRGGSMEQWKGRREGVCMHQWTLPPCCRGQGQRGKMGRQCTPQKLFL